MRMSRAGIKRPTRHSAKTERLLSIGKATNDSNPPVSALIRRLESPTHHLQERNSHHASVESCPIFPRDPCHIIVLGARVTLYREAISTRSHTRGIRRPAGRRKARLLVNNRPLLLQRRQRHRMYICQNGKEITGPDCATTPGLMCKNYNGIAYCVEYSKP